MKILYFTGFISVALGACSTTQSTLPEIASLTAVAEPILPRHQVHHHPVIQNFERREPTDPKSWRELNDDQSTAEGHSS